MHKYTEMCLLSLSRASKAASAPGFLVRILTATVCRTSPAVLQQLRQQVLELQHFSYLEAAEGCSLIISFHAQQQQLLSTTRQ